MMKVKTVILGNSFVCDKRLCTIVQRIAEIDESAIEEYFHLNHLSRKSHVIIVPESVYVERGFIYTGSDFVNPVTLERFAIDPSDTNEPIPESSSGCHSDEEYVDDDTTDIFDFIKSSIVEFGTMQRLNPYYNEFDEPVMLNYPLQDACIRSGPTVCHKRIENVSLDEITLFGIDGLTKYGYIGDGRWISLDDLKKSKGGFLR